MKFIESILLHDGMYQNLDLHQSRVNLAFDTTSSHRTPLDLKLILPKRRLKGKYKVRIVYDLENKASFDLNYEVYKPREIKSLEVVNSKPFDYSQKYEDRSRINELKAQSNADDIIICIDGKITDSSYANLAFFDGSSWYTPQNPLLNGVRRQQLLARKRLIEKPFFVSDISHFQKVSLINAMLDLGDISIKSDHIHF
ncbi:MAG: aminotransferase class IV [Bacteroidota bacterium]